ncbi:MAG: DUF2585 family protein [Patescibacteria group bacterium]
MTRGKYLIIALVLIVITGAVLFAMGRNSICQCGFVRLWSSDINGPENSQQVVDPYSFTHVLHGLGFYGLLHVVAPQISIPVRLLVAIGLEGGWEILENTNYTIDRYRTETVSLGYYGDSILNSLSDILMMIAGFYLAYKLRPSLTVLLFILIEIGLAFWIRDGLIINIIMLLYPLEALKQWQLGL